MTGRAKFNGRISFRTREPHTCIACRNPIPKGSKAVSFVRHVDGERVARWCHYPTCFEELGGQLVNSRTGERYRACTPIWVRLGKTQEWFDDLKKRIRAKKRELGRRAG